MCDISSFSLQLVNKNLNLRGIKTKTVFNLRLVLFFLCLITLPILAQNPTYEVYLKNGELMALNQLEFDIYIKRTGAVPFEVYNLQHCLIFDNSILNGGTPSFIYIPGTSEMNAAQVPTNPINILSVIGGNRIIRIPGRNSSGPGLGTIISDTGNGTRFGRFRLATTAPILSYWITINWNFNQATYGYATKYSAYVNGLIRDITIPSNHYSDLSNPCLSCYHEYEARLMNDVQIDANTYEFDIYIKNTTGWNPIKY